MPVKPPPRWTARSLTAMFMPHNFRKARSHAEAIGPFKEKVPLDADLNHMYIKSKEAKMVKAICHDFKLNRDIPKDTPKGFLWSVATGEWVPRHYLKLDTIFPFALGPMVAEAVSNRIYFRHSYNGMLLPPAVWGAFNNVSITSEAEASKFSLQGLQMSSTLVSQSPVAGLAAIHGFWASSPCCGKKQY